MTDFERVVNFKNMYKAYRRSKRGKGFKRSSAKFNVMALDGINQLISQLKNKTYTISEYNEFKVYDPKERIIQTTSYLRTLDLELNQKTQIFPVKNGVSYLGFHTFISSRGQRIIKLKNQNKRNAQRKYLKMAKLVEQGKLSIDKFNNSYRAWKNHASYCSFSHININTCNKIKKMIGETK